MKPIPFNNRYADLGENFYARITPAPVSNPALVIFNQALAEELGLADTCLASSDGAAILAGNRVPEGAAPLAMAYAGHQFGHFNPQLGDGRALLLGQIGRPDGTLADLHLKGSGRTLFSRGGDGRSALGPVLREYLVSEAMAKLGVPTTRALAAVSTGEQVARQELLPGAVITRIASSFVRVGTFEHFSSKSDLDAVTKLADYVIGHNYPDCRGAPQPYRAWFEAIIDRQAALIAQWMQLGFIHGVMNTDNMSIAGETIDYGPCAFMDHYTHDQVYSSIDHHGRYAYNNQPNIGLWNLTRLAESILPLLAETTEDAVEAAQAALGEYAGLYQGYWLNGMRAKTGLDIRLDEDKALINDLFDVMAENQADFTLTFYYLSRLAIDSTDQDESLRALFNDLGQIDHWLDQWRSRLKKENSDAEGRQARMQATNPVYIPRNHQIEAAIRAAEDQDDFTVFHDLHAVLQTPYERQPNKDVYMWPPEPDEVVQQTFCGT
ncbi:MAG: YdiU family protein [Gammaproteobacteria bacterium]|nr:YdiU family protein [Gammaproteobacteria bacterium]